MFNIIPKKHAASTDKNLCPIDRNQNSLGIRKQAEPCAPSQLRINSHPTASADSKPRLSTERAIPSISFQRTPSPFISLDRYFPKRFHRRISSLILSPNDLPAHLIFRAYFLLKHAVSTLTRRLRRGFPFSPP